MLCSLVDVPIPTSARSCGKKRKSVDPRCSAKAKQTLGQKSPVRVDHTGLEWIMEILFPPFAEIDSTPNLVKLRGTLHPAFYDTA